MATTKIAAELAKVAPWDAVDPRDLAELTRDVELETVPRKSIIYAQGERPSDLYVLVRGAAKSVRRGPQADAAEVARNVYRAPCVIVTASFLDRELEPSSLVTLRSSIVARVPRRRVMSLVRESREIASALFVVCAREMRARDATVDHMTLGSVDERVQSLLEALARAHGTPVDRGRFIPLPLTRSDIGDMVHATTATVSRVLAKMERDGRLRSTRDGLWFRTRVAQGTVDGTRPSLRPPRASNVD